MCRDGCGIGRECGTFARGNGRSGRLQILNRRPVSRRGGSRSRGRRSASQKERPLRLQSAPWRLKRLKHRLHGDNGHAHPACAGSRKDGTGKPFPRRRHEAGAIPPRKLYALCQGLLALVLLDLPRNLDMVDPFAAGRPRMPPNRSSCRARKASSPRKDRRVDRQERMAVIRVGRAKGSRIQIPTRSRKAEPDSTPDRISIMSARPYPCDRTSGERGLC